MGIYTALSGAVSAEERVNTIANNLANISTPGFKKDRLTFKEYLTELEKESASGVGPRGRYTWDDYNNLNGHDKAYVDIDTVETDFAQGAMQETGNPLDVAINGPGFLVVRTPSGVAFTRNGSLSVNRDGLLVNGEGHHVLSGTGNTLEEFSEISITGSRLDIDSEGNLYQDGNKTSKITPVEFEDLRGLKKIGDSLYVNKDSLINPFTISKSEIVQGAVEASNVNPIQEMVDMISATRAFEAYQNTIKSFDEINEKSVNQLGKLVG